MTARQSEFEEKWEELERLYGQALDLLEGLDRLGLYQAGAHLSLAIEVIRRQHPLLSPDERNSRT